MAQIRVIETGLEIYRTELGVFPDSRARQDPITDDPLSAGENTLSGTHWLVRALAGPDLLGVDKTGRCLTGDEGKPLRLGDLDRAKRGPLYIDAPKMRPARDNDDKLARRGDFAPTGRFVFLDRYEQPILYYRAYLAGQVPFSRRGELSPRPGGEPLGIYNHDDNARITGSDGRVGWDFADTRQGKPTHSLGIFGSIDLAHVDDNPPGRQGYTFTGYLRDSGALAKGVVRPVRKDSFVLISAGPDGVYGTQDDITNFPPAWERQ